MIKRNILFKKATMKTELEVVIEEETINKSKDNESNSYMESPSDFLRSKHRLVTSPYEDSDMKERQDEEGEMEYSPSLAANQSYKEKERSFSNGDLIQKNSSKSSGFYLFSEFRKKVNFCVRDY